MGKIILLAAFVAIKGEINVGTTKELPTVISFCSGYGGIERGLDLAGIKHRVIAYVEIEAYVIANLVAKMESGELAPAPIWTNLKTFPAHLFRGAVDIITGGYPCQPFSTAGGRKGEQDPRHLFPYIKEHIKTIRPDRCFFENVYGHVSMGLSTVVSDLEEQGYRTEWGVFSAREVGASHQRKRVFIMADTSCKRLEKYGHSKSDEFIESSKDMGDTNNAYSKRESIPSRVGEEYDDFNRRGTSSRGLAAQHWLPEPRVGRVVDGCADRVDRLRLLGNGVVPQTASKAWQILGDRYE